MKRVVRGIRRPRPEGREEWPEAYRAAAEQVENVLIEAFELWDQYEGRAGEGM